MEIRPIEHITLHNAIDIVAEWAPFLKGGAVKVFFVICRHTFDSQQRSTIITLSQMEKRTGLSRKSILKHVKDLENLKLIKKEIVCFNGKDATTYELLLKNLYNYRHL